MKYQNENFNGTLDFRSGFHKGWWMETHLHEYSEILYCQTGEGDVFVNGNHIRLRRGQFVWLPPNCVHQYDFQDAELVCAVFSHDLIPLYFRATEGKRLVVAALEAEELASILGGLYKLNRSHYLQISGCLNLICAKVMDRSRLEAAGCTDGVLYQKVITYLSEHYAEDITLAQLAKLFGYHEKYLSHALHELTGIHFRQLLAYYRVNRAQTLLIEQPRATVTTIATECGFSAINTFHRAFRDITGMTPLAYRRKFGK